MDHTETNPPSDGEHDPLADIEDQHLIAMFRRSGKPKFLHILILCRMVKLGIYTEEEALELSERLFGDEE